MGERIYLRALEIDDYKTSIQWRKDSQIWNMLGGVKYFVSEAYEKKWVENAIFNSKDVRLAICLSENDKYIGNVYMTDLDETNRSCQSHILIGDKEYWGQGYAKEALLKAIEYMFKERNINRIQAVILESNKQSLRMHQKCGYKVEGLLRKSVFKSGQYQNQYILSILREDYEL